MDVLSIAQQVDELLLDTVVRPPDDMQSVLGAAREAGLPAIEVSAAEGKLLHLLVRMHGARRVLELGTLAGYSTIWMARALPPEGGVVSLELDPRFAALATANVAAAGLAPQVEIMVGPAEDSLRALVEAESEPFDFIFLDADKANTATYYEWALQLSRIGSVIVADNVVRAGGILDGDDGDPSIRGVRSLLTTMKTDDRVAATAIQTVGGKGHDGFAIAVVQRPSA